jgi:MFS transporter, DHA1 family, multidrug resistance protein
MAISFTVAIGFGMVIPVLPLYAKSFGVGLAAIGLVQLVFGTTRFGFGLIGGLMVDRFGERASTVAGLLIVAASSFAAGLSTNFPQFVLARGFGGAGSALFINGLMNRIIRTIEPQAMGRATGVFRSSFLVGIGAGPALGGIVAEHFGLAAPLLFYGAGLLLATVIAWFVMAGGERGTAAERRSPLEAVRLAAPLFRDTRYVVALLATAVGWWTVSGPAQVVGVVFARSELHLSKPQIGLALTLLSVGELLVLIVAGRLADRYGRRAVIVPALLISALATAGLGRSSGSPIAFYVLLMLIGGSIAGGATAAGGLLADSIPRGGSGAAVGLNQMAGDLGYLLSPAAVGALAEATSFMTAYFVAAVPALLVLGVALRLPTQRSRRRAGIPGEPAEPATPVA